MQGVHAEIRTRFAQSAQKYIVSSRMAQGEDDYANASAEEREDVEVRWLAEKEQMRGFYLWKQKEKGKAKDGGSPAPSDHGSVITDQIVGNEPPKTGWLHTRSLSFDERKKLQDQKKAWRKKKAEAAATGGTFIDEAPRGPGTDRAGDDEFEAAILTAVRETSRGNTSEDARVEQAIRSSVRALRSRSATVNSFASASTMASRSTAQDSGYISDFKRPIPEPDNRLPRTDYDIKHPPSSPPTVPPRTLEDLDITDEEYQALIEQAVQLSMAEQPRGIVRRDTSESDDDEEFRRVLERSQTERSAEDEHDEEYKKALEASQAERQTEGVVDDEEELRKALEASQAEQTGAGGDDEEELRRALEESERAHREELKRASSLKTEEDIVMEYVKKQSLAEEEFRKSTKGKQTSRDDDDEQEQLRRALEESMQSWGGVSGRGGGGGPSTF